MFHYQLVKRRKPLLVEEPLIPTVSTVKKKYRSGTIIGKFVRYISEHKNTRKILAGNFAAVAIATSFLPSVSSNDVSAATNGVIHTPTQLVTEKGIQSPVNYMKVNQGYSFFHPGIDIGGPIGSPIRPIKAGVVTEASYTKDGYGNNVVVDHGNGLVSRYAHLSKIQTKTGETVSMDTEIGKLGVTGRTTGPHLHLEITQDGAAINPTTVLPR